MSTHSPPYKSKYRFTEKGFTLIELIVVIVILAVMAVVAVPQISTNGVGDFRTTWAMNEVKALIIYAQRHAIQTQVRTRITFNTGSNDIRLHRETTPDTNTWTYMNSPKESGSNFNVALGSGAFEGMTITATDIGSDSAQSIVFDRYGTPYDRGTVGHSSSDADPPAALTSTGTVSFNGAGGWEIQIEPETGHVQIVDV